MNVFPPAHAGRILTRRRADRKTVGETRASRVMRFVPVSPRHKAHTGWRGRHGHRGPLPLPEAISLPPACPRSAALTGCHGWSQPATCSGVLWRMALLAAFRSPVLRAEAAGTGTSSARWSFGNRRGRPGGQPGWRLPRGPSRETRVWSPPGRVLRSSGGLVCTVPRRPECGADRRGLRRRIGARGRGPADGSTALPGRSAGIDVLRSLTWRRAGATEIPEGLEVDRGPRRSILEWSGGACLAGSAQPPLRQLPAGLRYSAPCGH